jgi:hypothetical protein
MENRSPFTEQTTWWQQLGLTETQVPQYQELMSTSLKEMPDQIVHRYSALQEHTTLDQQSLIIGLVLWEITGQMPEILR